MTFGRAVAGNLDFRQAIDSGKTIKLIYRKYFSVLLQWALKEKY